jgi:hypothetical protein
VTKTKSPTKLASSRVILLVCVVLSFCFVGIVSAQSTVVNAGASTSQPIVGSTLTVTITISNVQNLGGIDATLQWNDEVLSLTNSVLSLGVESHSNGVLHGTINTDSNNQNSGDIFVQETKVSGSYALVATEVGQTYSGFTGSGTIVTLTFNVISTGNAGLSLQTDLADHPPAGQKANNISHQDTVSSVTAVVAGASSTPTTSSTPTSSHSSTPQSSPSPTVPEFSNMLFITILIIAGAASIAILTKLPKNRANLSFRKAISS